MAKWQYEVVRSNMLSDVRKNLCKLGKLGFRLVPVTTLGGALIMEREIPNAKEVAGEKKS